MRIVFNKNKKYQDEIAKYYLKAMEVLLPSVFDLEVNIAFVSRREIKKLNKSFRGFDKVTDVLSFPTMVNDCNNLTGKVENSNFSKIIVKTISKEKNHLDMNVLTGNLILGDIYICLSKAKKQAREYGHSANREVAYLAVHGLLHLFGYDHMVNGDKQIMREVEKTIFDEN